MWFTNFFNHPEYIQKPKSRDGYITNVNPMSRRYLTPDSLSIDDTEGADESVCERTIVKTAFRIDMECG